MSSAEHDSPAFDVLILGASFAGIEVYHQLRRSRRGRKLSVCIVDRQAEHGYIPLVHERLLGRLRWERSLLATQAAVSRDPHASYIVAEVMALDAKLGQVVLDTGDRLEGRALVVALGSELAPPPELPGREHLLRYKFGSELAPAQRVLRRALERPASHLVVIGGGISGVELAGELAHWVSHHQTAQRPTISLIEAGDRLLAGMHERARRFALRALEAQGVRVRLSTKLLRVGEHVLEVQARAGQPEELAHDAVFWSAGIRPNPLLAHLGLALSSRGYLAVSPTLRCRATDGSAVAVFACGDAVRVIDERGEWPTLQRAIECIWQGKVVARNILALDADGSTAALRSHVLWRDFPYGVSIGGRSLIVFGPLVLSLGFLAIWFRRFLMQQYFRRYR